ncbi:MAG TPA: amidohydrolase family protein [Candidatus Binatia bacterium]|jgi:hypothetical protein|nr:amidohydrolase family protein [Candidatus Binatia bacterium]
MARSTPIVDVWTQYLRPTAPGTNPAGENVFRNYGMLEEYHGGTNLERMIERMDAAGVAVALMAGDNEAVAKAMNRFPGRIYGQYHADPTHVMKAVRELEHYVRSCGFVSLRIEPFLWRKPPTDRTYYPLYAKAVELDVTFQTQVGETGPLYPSETGRPLYIDEVALDFPELRIVCGHIGIPWTEEMLGVAFKHANVWIDTSARVPKHWPESFVKFLRTYGKDKVCFATDYPLLQWERVLPEVDAMALPPDVQRRFLRDNAVRAFKLPL